MTVNVPARTCPCTLFGDTVPAKTANDGTAVELGVRFTADADGQIRALRYYSPGGSGVRLGHLWSANGAQQLAEVTFPATQGWHETALATPVPVTAGTTYVASFYAADGQYAYTDNFFLDAYDSAPLHAPATGNGVYFYGGGFPNTPSSDAANYFADVAFVSNDHAPPHVTAVSPADGATGVDTGTALAAIFDEAIDPSSVSSTTFLLRDGTGALVPAGVSYAAATRTATLTPRSRLAPGVRYSAVVKGGAGGVRDTSANALAQDRAWSFTTAPLPGGGGGGSGEAGGGGGAPAGSGAGSGTPGAGPAGPAGAEPRVRITPRSVRVSRTGTVALRVACPRDAGSCRVKLSLALGRKVVAAKTLSVLGGRTKTATLRLSRAARRTLARKSSLSVVVSATTRDSAGRQATTRTSIRLRAPRS